MKNRIQREGLADADQGPGTSSQNITASLALLETRPCYNVCEARPGMETSSILAHGAESKWPRPCSFKRGPSRWKSLKTHLSGLTLPPVDFLSSGNPVNLSDPSSVSAKQALSTEPTCLLHSHTHRTGGPSTHREVSGPGGLGQAGQQGTSKSSCWNSSPRCFGHECGAY